MTSLFAVRHREIYAAPRGFGDRVTCARARGPMDYVVAPFLAPERQQ